MAAIEGSDPIALVIPVKSNDLALHSALDRVAAIPAQVGSPWGQPAC